MILRSKITTLLLLVSFAGFTQKGTDRQPDINTFLPHLISLPVAEKKYKPVLPISTLEVYDARFDTTSIGLLQKPAGIREKWVRLKHGTTNDIREYLKSLIALDSATHNDFSLICFIKKLILSDKIFINGNNTVGSKDPVYEIKSGAMATFEFYAKQGEAYLPLYRFDTTATGEKDVFYKGENYIASILTASLRKMELLDPDKIKIYNKPKRLFEIDSFNNTRFAIPILNENPKKGIYINFTDFKNNTPIDSPFSVDKSSRGDFLYIKNKKGEDILQTDIWGYSDGKNAYIHSAENFFKLSRDGNTFIIYGAKSFTSIRKLRLNFSLLDTAIPNSNYSKARTKNSYQLILNFFQLDMESGELY